jgi:hypothetical protein
MREVKVKYKTIRIFLLIVLSLGLILGMYFTRGAEYVAIFALIAFAVFGFKDPDFAIMSFITFVFIPFGYMERFVFNVSSFYIFFPELLLIIAFLSNLFRLKKLPKLSVKNVWWVVSFWFFPAFISAAINEVSLFTVLINYRWLIYLLICIVLFNNYFGVGKKEFLLRILVFIGILNLPVIIVQRYWVFISPLIRGADRACGLFSSYTSLVFFQIFCILAVLLYWHQRKRLFKVHPALIILALVSVLALSNSRAAWFFLILAVSYVFIKFKFLIYKPKLIIASVMFLTLSIVIFGYIMTVSYPGRVSRRFAHIRPTYIFRHSFGKDFFDPEPRYLSGGSLYLERGEGIIFGFNLIRENTINLLIGMGPGAGDRSRIPNLNGRIYEKYGESTRLSRTTVMRSVLELGLMGVAIWIFFLLVLYDTKIYRDNSSINRRLLKSTVFLVFLLSFYYRIILSMPFVLIISILLINSESGCNKKL